MENKELFVESGTRVSDLTKDEKVELGALSREVFGSSSKWLKMIDKGVTELVTEEVTEFVPSADEDGEGTTRQVNVPVKAKNGALQYRIKRHTVDSIKSNMLTLKAQIEAFKTVLAKMRAEQDAAKAASELADKVHQHVGGSAT